MAAANTVTVGSKLPNGLILSLCAMAAVPEPVMGGGMREVKMAQRLPQTVTLHGTAVPFGKQPKCLMASGYALTPNVDAEFFAKWQEQNADSEIVRKGMVMAYAKPADVEAAAKEREKVQTGLEPLDMESIGKARDSRIPRGIQRAAKEAA